MTAAVQARIPAPQWTPDPMLAAAARAGGVQLLQLDEDDQNWLVACLTVEGFTVEEIAARCGCRSRKIKYVRARPMTKMMTRYLVAQAQADEAAQRVEALDRWCELTVSQCEQGSQRARDQLDAAVDQIRALRARCREQQHRADTYRKYCGAPPPRRSRPPAAAPVDQLALF
ncbi:hypothetical protein [Nocardia sp. CA-290969]|uniref:hypothetical protein n=1 Tax=Nocardia sp. CA-290969 TaxID=3239986 RepID=UPI003D8A195F